MNFSTKVILKHLYISALTYFKFCKFEKRTSCFSRMALYNTVSQLNNSDLETPDDFDNSETSPYTFSQPPFQPLYSLIRFEPPSTPSSVSNVTPTYSPLNSEPSDNNSSVNTQITHELDDFITLQQQLLHPQRLTIHQLSQSIISSNPSTPTPSSNYTPSPNTSPSSNPTSSSTNRAYRRSNQVFQSLPTIQSRQSSWQRAAAEHTSAPTQKKKKTTAL